MITGMHTVIYSSDPEQDRAFFKDVLKFPYVDVGGGWLIFATPPAEVAFHPTEGARTHEAYLMCDDIEAQTQELQEAGHACSPLADEGWGIVTSLTLPSGASLGLYQPRHALPPRQS